VAWPRYCALYLDGFGRLLIQILESFDPSSPFRKARRRIEFSSHRLHESTQRAQLHVRAPFRSDVAKRVTCHTLRHFFAIRLLVEARKSCFTHMRMP
jgi:integrase